MFAAHRATAQLTRGRAALAAGDAVQAEQWWESALRTARLGDAWLVAGDAASALGDLARDTGELGKAAHHYRLGTTQYARARRSARSVGGEVRCRESLGDVLLLTNRPWDAYREFMAGAKAAGVNVTEPVGEEYGVGFISREDMRWTAHLATAAQAAGRHRLAHDHYQRVLTGCESRRDVPGQIMCWKGLAALAERRMAWQDAAHALYNASNLYPELPDPEAHTSEWVQCLRDLGGVYKTLGRRDDQVRAFKLAVRLEAVAAPGQSPTGNETMTHDEHSES